MRVYVSVDIEGIAGVVNGEEGARGNSEYERSRRLMTAEASAVVAGIFDADANAHVTVADGHGMYRNLIPEELDERATIYRGKPRVFAMVDGIDRGYDTIMFVGYHGRAGAGPSVLSHTFNGSLFDIRINGTSYGELGLNAALAGAYGVPPALVAGDQSVAEEARDLFGSEVLTVTVKESRGHMTAESIHPNLARRNLREAAAVAVRDGARVPPLRVGTPVAVEITFSRPVYADLAEMVENVERTDGRTVRFTRPDMPTTYRVLRLIATLGTTPT
jgi:D-amino peptidase